ncbi:MAG: hypothetical protein AB7D07_15995 [Desulfovibrionaceae bacterium]
MPRIPTYERQLGPQSPQFQPTPLQVQPGAAGEDIWKAVQQAGKDLQQVSGDLFKIAKGERQRNDIYETKKVYADASKQLNEAMYGENGYLVLSGRNADGVYEKAQQRIEEIGKAAKERLQNDDQRWRFDQMFGGDVVQGLKQVIAHQTEQRRVGEIDTTKSLRSTAVNDFVAGAGNDEAMDLAMDKVRSTTLSLAKLQGWSPEQTEGEFENQRSIAVQGVVNQYLERGDPMKAKEFFEKKKDLIAGKDQPALAGKIKSEVEAFELERDVNASMVQVSALPYAERLKFVEQLPVGTEQQRKVRGLVSMQVNALEENRKRQEAESSFKAAESVYNRIAAARSDSSKAMPTVMEIEKLDLPGDVKARLMNEVDSRTSRVETTEAKTAKAGAELRLTVAKLNGRLDYEALGKELSNLDAPGMRYWADQVLQEKTAAQKQDAKDKESAVSRAEARSVASEMMQAAGIAQKKTPELWSKVLRRVDAMIDRGGWRSFRELEDAIQRELDMGVIRDSGYFRDDRVRRVEARQPDGTLNPDWYLKPDDAGEQRTKDLLRSRGLPTDENSIEDAYTYMIDKYGDAWPRVDEGASMEPEAGEEEKAEDGTTAVFTEKTGGIPR